MKDIKQYILPAIVIIYLLIGLGIDQYTDDQASQNESFLQGVARETARYSPGHIWRIVMWPFYL